MTYARFLLRFLVVPIVLLAILVLRDHYQAQKRGRRLLGWSPILIVAALIMLAILYTTPWDNHLIATRVWWYRPTLVSGITIGWIPLEELLFFLLQTLLIGLWFFWLIPRSKSRFIAANLGDGISRHVAGDCSSNRGRLIAVIVGCCLWLVALVILLLGWRPGTYLGWEVIWALPPFVLQLGLGGDILWRHRRLVCAAVIPVLIYLSAVDTLALHEGIWTIDPQQSLGMRLGGQLPLEELIFFLLTSALVAFGLVLGVANESRRRFDEYRRWSQCSGC